MALDGTTTVGEGNANTGLDETITGTWTHDAPTNLLGDVDFNPNNDHLVRGTNSTFGVYDTVQQTYVLWFDRRAIANNIGGPEYNGAVRFSNCMLWENNNGEVVVRDSGGIDTVIS